jgi:hypothetical protein
MRNRIVTAGNVMESSDKVNESVGMKLLLWDIGVQQLIDEEFSVSQ